MTRVCEVNKMDEPIRILQHVRILDSGGIEAFIFANLRAMDRDKVNFDFLVTRDKIEFYDEELERLGCRKIVLEYKHFSNNLLNPISQALAFYKFCKKNKKVYRIIHFQSIGANGFFDIIAAAMAGIPWRIAHSHIANDIKPGHKSNKKTAGEAREAFVKFRQAVIRQIVTRFSTTYFGCSKMACEWMFTKKANRQGKTIVVNNPIDVKKFEYSVESRETIRKKLGVEDKFVIGHVGRFVYSKNHMFLLETFAEVVKKNKDAVLVCVGEGKLRHEIENKIQELEIKDNVILYGETTEISKVYNAFDLFLFPSHYEGLGIVLVEAQANGLPVVAADTIPSEVNLTDNFEFMSLDEGKLKWAQRILDRRKEKRNFENAKKVYKAGYDIRDVSQFLQNTYIEMYNN